LIEEFQQYGLEWNAYTSSTNIVFYLIGLDKYVSKFKYTFLNRLNQININNDEFELEKSVVLEEYSSIFNVQSSSHKLNLYRKLFNSYSSIGRKEDIEKLTLEDCKNHFDEFYKNPSKIINISKNNIFEQYIDFKDFNSNNKFEYIYNNNAEINYFQSKLNKSSIIYLSPMIYEDWPIIFFINYLLSNGINSPLYKNIRKKTGLSYYINCDLDRLSDNSGINMIYTETDDNKVDKLMQVLDDTLSNTSFLTKNKIEQVRNSIINKIDTVNINRYINVEKYIKPEPWSIENHIHDITLEQVERAYLKYYNVNNFYKNVDKIEFN